LNTVPEQAPLENPIWGVPFSPELLVGFCPQFVDGNGDFISSIFSAKIRDAPHVTFAHVIEGKVQDRLPLSVVPRLNCFIHVAAILL